MTRQLTAVSGSSLLVVLLRRRWRIDHGWLSWILVRWGVTSPAIRGYVDGTVPGIPPNSGILLLMGLRVSLAIVLGMSAGAAIAATAVWILGISPIEVSVGVLILPQLLAMVAALSSWKKAGSSPVVGMARLTPARESFLARVSLCVETTLFLQRSVGLFALLAGYVSFPGSFSLSSLIAVIGVLVVQVIVAAVCFVAVCGLRIDIARLSIESPFTWLGLAWRCIRLGLVCSLGYLIAKVLFVVPLRQFREHFNTIDHLLVDDRWELFGRTVIVELIDSMLSTVSTWDANSILTVIISGSALVLFLAAAAVLIRIPKLLDPLHAPLSPASWKGFSRTWMKWQSKESVSFCTAGMVLSRRMCKPSWATVHVFWRTLLPPAEAVFFIGVWAAVLEVGNRCDVDLAFSLVAAVLIGHILASDIRDETSTIYSMVRESAVIPIIMQARKAKPLEDLTKARIRVQRRHVLVPSTVVAGIIAGVSLLQGKSQWMVLVAVIAVLCVAQIGVAVQWYMTPLLLSEAHFLRAEESGEFGTAAVIQRQLQAVPRYGLVVIPSLFTLSAVIAPTLFPTQLMVTVVVVTCILHGFVFAVQPYVTQRLAKVAWKCALNSLVLK